MAWKRAIDSDMQRSHRRPISHWLRVCIKYVARIANANAIPTYYYFYRADTLRILDTIHNTRPRHLLTVIPRMANVQLTERR